MIHDIDHIYMPELSGKKIDDVSLPAFCLWLFAEIVADIKKPLAGVTAKGKYKVGVAALIITEGCCYFLS